MTGLDYVILAVVVVSALVGAVRGFLREACSLVTWVLAVWLASHFGPALEPWMGGALRQAPFGLWAGRGIVFFLVLIAGTLVGVLVSRMVRLSLFSGMDRFLGFLMGVARGIVAMAVLVILGQSVQLQGERWWEHSRLVKQIEPVAGLLRSLAGGHL
ncbi:MAG: CvpA family protein [Steroidobacteraceae bacterium]